MFTWNSRETIPADEVQRVPVFDFDAPDKRTGAFRLVGRHPGRMHGRGSRAALVRAHAAAGARRRAHLPF